MVMSPEKGLHTIFPHLTAVCLREKRIMSGGPQEASVGDSISLIAVCHLNKPGQIKTRKKGSLLVYKKCRKFGQVEANGLYFIHYCLSSRWEHLTWL